MKDVVNSAIGVTFEKVVNIKHENGSACSAGTGATTSTSSTSADVTTSSPGEQCPGSQQQSEVICEWSRGLVQAHGVQSVWFWFSLVRRS